MNKQSPIPSYKDAQLSIEARIDDLLARMTLEEKAGQMHQTVEVGPAELGMIRKGLIGSYICETDAQAGNVRQERVRVNRLNEIQKTAVEESRLGIPLLFARDVIHGHRTVAPIPLGQAASWSPELVQAAAQVAAREAASDGIRWVYTPMLDIARDPRWGRIAEGFGEDPYLTSSLARAAVNGYQGGDLSNPEHVAACAKHFAGYGAAEGGRDYNTVEISRHTMHNVYMPPFRAAVEAGLATIMNAFHDLDGLPLVADHYWNTEILKDLWGFSGLIVSDWAAIGHLIAHGVSADEAEAAALAVNAGTDIDMQPGIYLRHIPDLVRTGRIPAARVDDAVRRILRIKFALGLFERPYTDPKLAETVHLRPDHVEVVRALARKSMVLLKNQNDILPLPKEKLRIGLCGPLAEARHALFGTWTLDGVESDIVNLHEALQNSLAASSSLIYKNYWDEAVKASRTCDVMVVALGESPTRSGEDNSTAEIELPPGQVELLEALHAVGVPIVAVIFGGRPLLLSRIAELADAVLMAWHPGISGGWPVAEVLFGDENPGGKLPVSFPRSTGQIPIYYNHKPTGHPLSPDTRAESRYNDSLDSPLFPFGFGLSYTTFAYSDIRVDRSEIKKGQPVTISALVTNTGKRPGEETAQCYVRDCVASLTRPVRELKGFTHISLEPGQAKRVTFVLGPAELSFYNNDGQSVLEPGEFKAWVGGDSRTTLETSFQIKSG